MSDSTDIEVFYQLAKDIVGKKLISFDYLCMLFEGGIEITFTDCQLIGDLWCFVGLICQQLELKENTLIYDFGNDYKIVVENPNLTRVN